MHTILTFDDISPLYISKQKFLGLLKTLDEINLKGTFFVVPKHIENLKEDDDFLIYLKNSIDKGHEIAMHGYEHKKNEFDGSYEKQIKIISKGLSIFENKLNINIFGFRAPFYRINNKTLRALKKLNFKYDSSKTVYKPTHSRFRFRMYSSYPVMEEGILEIPVYGDYTYNLTEFKNSLKRALNDFDFLGVDGIFVINNHIKRSEYFKFLKSFFMYVSHRTNFLRLIDLVEIWKIKHE